MRFALEIDMDNAAFEDDRELHRVLATVNAYGGRREGILRDFNGNRVGHWEITE